MRTEHAVEAGVGIFDNGGQHSLNSSTDSRGSGECVHNLEALIFTNIMIYRVNAVCLVPS